MNVVLYLRAVNDINGNPRRLFVLLENGIVKRVVDEGYRGIPREFINYPIVAVDVTPTEYRKWLNSI